MSDKRRRRRQNSEDSEHSEGEVGTDKVLGEDLDIDKDEGVVSRTFLSLASIISNPVCGQNVHLGYFLIIVAKFKDYTTGGRVKERK